MQLFFWALAHLSINSVQLPLRYRHPLPTANDRRKKPKKINSVLKRHSTMRHPTFPVTAAYVTEAAIDSAAAAVALLLTFGEEITVITIVWFIRLTPAVCQYLSILPGRLQVSRPTISGVVCARRVVIALIKSLINRSAGSQAFATCRHLRLIGHSLAANFSCYVDDTRAEIRFRKPAPISGTFLMRRIF